MARAHELVPRLAERAAQAEVERRLADDSIAELSAAGLFRVLSPRRVGGLGGDLRAMLEIARELAHGCGSAAWVTTIHNTCAWLVGLASAEAQGEVWAAGPDVRVAGVLAPTATARRIDKGLVISGRWSWASGCLHAQWCLVGVPIVDASGQAIDHGLALVPAGELTIVDTWFQAGMRGTGSHTLVAEEVFVPEHRLLSFSQLLFSAVPVVPVAALVLVGPLLGLAAAALERAIAEVSAANSTFLPGMTRAASPSVQLALAEAATLVDTAHLHAYRAAADIDD
ncbi:MAG TPA: acyl-CoA dehydrogenase family protein, partial [Nannocystis sp.]